MSDKGLISKLCGELIQFNIKIKSPIKKWTDLNSHFSRGHTEGQETHEKMPDINNHQGNANQHHKVLAGI